MDRNDSRTPMRRGYGGCRERRAISSCSSIMTRLCWTMMAINPSGSPRNGASDSALSGGIADTGNRRHPRCRPGFLPAGRAPLNGQEPPFFVSVHPDNASFCPFFLQSQRDGSYQPGTPIPGQWAGKRDTVDDIPLFIKSVSTTQNHSPHHSPLSSAEIR